MNHIDPALWSKLSPLMDELLDMDDEQRARRIEALRAQDPIAADALHELLGHAKALEGEDFLAGDASALACGASLGGQRIGAYTLERVVGEGGMGTVWLARRSDGRFDGAVAVKILNLALVGRGGAERFAREGRILGRLTHPNIARMLDAGVTPGGQPYLVLEYVAGVPLDEYCDASRLDTRHRIALLLEVMDAVSHAHRNLALHRDLKPSNILVTDDGDVKLLDFGIAKLLLDADAPGGATELTKLAGRAFTPEYAAPEQFQGDAVTTATDVYSLGVLLYRLLAGRHPTTQDTDTAVERLRAVTERVPPRLSVVAQQVAQDIAERRATTPGHLARELRGDLETIVGKSLKKEPAERYATVDAFADDLRRYLRGEPVSARPDSMAYRTSRFVRRNLAAVALVAFALVALVGGLFGTISQAQRATREAQEASIQRDFALRQLARRDALNDLDTLLLTDAVHAGKPLRVGDLLARAEKVVDHQQGPVDATRVDMLVAIGNHYKFMDRDDKARALLGRAYAASRSLSDPSARAAAGCSYGLAIAESEHARGAALIRESLSELPHDHAFDLERLVCYQKQGEMARNNDDAKLAIESAEAARRLVEGLPFPSPNWRVRVLMDRGESYRIGEQNQKAVEDFQAAEQQLIALGREETETATTLYNNWALSLYFMGRPLEAGALFRRAMQNTGGDNATGVSPMLLLNYARVVNRLDNFAEAAKLADTAYGQAKAAGDEVIVNQALLLRASAYRALGALAKSDAVLAEAEPRLRRMLPEGHRAFASLASQWALLAQARGDFATALALADRAVRLAGDEQTNAPHLAQLLRLHAELDIAMQRAGEAYANAERALALEKKFVTPGMPSADVGMAYLTLGRAARLRGDLPAARVAWTAAVEELRPTLGPEHPDTRDALQALAMLGP